MDKSPAQFEKLKNFQEVFQKGKKFKTRTSQIIFLIEKKESLLAKVQLQVGLIALKKIVGKKAVCRNKAKRRFKHGFLSQMKALNFPGGICVKIIALTNKNTLSCAWDQILEDITKSMSYIAVHIASPPTEPKG